MCWGGGGEGAEKKAPADPSRPDGSHRAHSPEVLPAAAPRGRAGPAQRLSPLRAIPVRCAAPRGCARCGRTCGCVCVCVRVCNSAPSQTLNLFAEAVLVEGRGGEGKKKKKKSQLCVQWIREGGEGRREGDGGRAEIARGKSQLRDPLKGEKVLL